MIWDLLKNVLLINFVFGKVIKYLNVLFVMTDYECGGSRNKKKDKMREKKKNPYKTGGRFRSSEIKDTDNSSKKVTNLKKRKAKKRK
jgi:hypothetical protein